MPLASVEDHSSKTAQLATVTIGEQSAPAVTEHRPKVFLMVAWFGLLTGLTEVCILGVQKFVLHRAINKGPDVIWMAPLADVFILLIPGGILFLASRLWPRQFSSGFIAFALAFLGFFSLLFMFHPKLHKIAAMLLAAGLAVQAARYIAAHVSGFQLLMRRTAVWMVGVLAVATLGFHGSRILSERRALEKLPPAAAGASNVLLIVLDTVRAQNLSLYGYSRPTTPHLERLARRGMRFDLALSTAPWTLPSHATMFTGRYPHELSADWLTPLDGTYPTLAEVFGKHGYRTAGFVANTGYGSYEQGLNRGFSHYEDYFISPGAIITSSSLGRFITESPRLRRTIGYYQTLGRKTAENVNEEFLSWLNHNNERPFFVFLNYYDAHGPYGPPESSKSTFGTGKSLEWNPIAQKKDVAPKDIQAMVDGYDSSIAFLDHHIGLLTDELERQGILENTLVVITSDHGEEFGEHDVFDHGHTLYLQSVHVPLLILFPERVPVGNIKELVTLRDVASTITDLVQLETTASLPGNSLARYWCTSCDTTNTAPSPVLAEVNHARNLPPWLPVSRGNMKSLAVDSLRYVKNGDGREELYELNNDLSEKFSLADSEHGRRSLVTFQTLLKAVLEPK